MAHVPEILPKLMVHYATPIWQLLPCLPTLGPHRNKQQLEQGQRPASTQAVLSSPGLNHDFLKIDRVSASRVLKKETFVSKRHPPLPKVNCSAVLSSFKFPLTSVDQSVKPFCLSPAAKEATFFIKVLCPQLFSTSLPRWLSS